MTGGTDATAAVASGASIAERADVLRASETVAAPVFDALALEGADSVNAVGHWVTVVTTGATLVNVVASKAIARVADVAGATVAGKTVQTLSIDVTCVLVGRAFVDVDTSGAVVVLCVAGIAVADKASGSVDACRMFHAIVCTFGAFVDVSTCLAITGVADIARACKATEGVGAGSIVLVTVVNTSLAFVDVETYAGAVRAEVSFIAFTRVATILVDTARIVLT